MIEFASLFLGFVLGVRPVELAVDTRVAAVVLELDGRESARLEAPPWTAEVDFGSELVPHRLEALALDAAGRPIERIRKLVNYARADYEAAIVLEPAGSTEGRRGRVVWAAVLDQDPIVLELAFDGRRLAVEPDGGFALPAYDREESHFLEARLTFEDGQTLTAELAFGGRFGDRVTSALSAVPITSPPGRPWSTREVRGWLERDGRPLEVFAARAEEGVLILVRDEGAAKDLRRLFRGQEVAPATGVRSPAFDVTAVSPRPLRSHDNTFELIRLGRAASPADLSRKLADEGFRFSRHRRARRQHLWDAVALAGRHAASSNRPRAVVLMVGREPADRGFLGAAQAARFLASVRVPLFVWGPGVESVSPFGLEDRTFHGVEGLSELAERAAAGLASQTVVWLEGEYLPAEISLGDAAPPGVELIR
jgi:hypothetical protein